MNVRLLSLFKQRWLSALLLLALLSVVMLVLLAFRAVSAWQKSEARLAERRTEAAAELLVTAITRDMRAVHRVVLSSPPFTGLATDLPPDIGSIGSVFARYPYPEAFFWTSDPAARGSLVFYTRTDRPPAWITSIDPNNRFPVTVAQDLKVGQQLLDRFARDGMQGRTFSAFDLPTTTATLQVVALLTYTDRSRLTVDSVFGFIVNLDWAKKNYFDELATQVAAMNVGAADRRWTILDADGTVIAGHALDTAATPAVDRSFPVLFFDPSVVAVSKPPDLALQYWTARASVFDGHGMWVGAFEPRAAVWLVAFSAIALVAALILTARATRTNAELVQLRSDFVSAVTHELKTPVAVIRALTETLALGRSGSPDLSREYAKLAVHETTRLTRLIDNLLAYSRIADVTEAYSFEPLDVASVVHLTAKEFTSQLSTAGFSVMIDVPPTLPKIRADSASIVLALGNLIDNAIRYSTGARELRIGARVADGRVVIDVADAGIGISEADIGRVTERFYRGSSSIAGGSGLGLAIVERIIGDHSGCLTIRSQVGAGTTVSVSLPTMR